MSNVLNVNLGCDGSQTAFFELCYLKHRSIQAQTPVVPSQDSCTARARGRTSNKEESNPTWAAQQEDKVTRTSPEGSQGHLAMLTFWCSPGTWLSTTLPFVNRDFNITSKPFSPETSITTITCNFVSSISIWLFSSFPDFLPFASKQLRNVSVHGF